MTRVPFSFDLSDGLVTVRGTVSIKGDDIVIATRRALLDLVPYRTDTFRLPVGEVASIEVESGLVRHRLIIEPFEALADFPGDTDGALVLPIKRKHCGAAEALARQARLSNLPR